MAYDRTMVVAALHALVPVVVGGAGVCALGAWRAGATGRRIVRTAAAVLLLVLASALLFALAAAAVWAWDDRPERVVVGAFLLVGTLGLLTLVHRAAHERRGGHPESGDEGGGDDGGGGQRRRPTTPRVPPSSGPAVPAAPWDEFDAIRSTWDRVPAGRR